MAIPGPEQLQRAFEERAKTPGCTLRMRHLGDEETSALGGILGAPLKRWVAVLGSDGRIRVLKAHTRDELLERVRATFANRLTAQG